MVPTPGRALQPRSHAVRPSPAVTPARVRGVCTNGVCGGEAGRGPGAWGACAPAWPQGAVCAENTMHACSGRHAERVGEGPRGPILATMLTEPHGSGPLGGSAKQVSEEMAGPRPSAAHLEDPPPPGRGPRPVSRRGRLCVGVFSVEKPDPSRTPAPCSGFRTIRHRPRKARRGEPGVGVCTVSLGLGSWQVPWTLIDAAPSL